MVLTVICIEVIERYAIFWRCKDPPILLKIVEADVRKCGVHNVEDCNDNNEEGWKNNRVSQIFTYEHQENGEEEWHRPEHKCGRIHQPLEGVEIPLHVRVKPCRDFDSSEEKEYTDTPDAAEKNAPRKEADEITES